MVRTAPEKARTHDPADAVPMKQTAAASQRQVSKTGEVFDSVTLPGAKLESLAKIVPTTGSLVNKTRRSLDRAASFIHGSDTEYVNEVVVLSRFARRFIWATVMLLILGNIALLTTFAVVYMQNSKRDSFLWLFRVYFLFSKGNAFLHDHSEQVAAGYAVLSAIFGFVALRFIYSSLQKRQLRFGNRSMRASQFSRRLSAFGSMSKKPKSFTKWYKRWQAMIGVRGPYFDLRLLVEETIEVASQTAAAHSASQTISNVPLNVLYALMILLNCIASLVYRRVFKASLIKQRLACLLTDIVIDFVWGSLLPIWMYWPLIKIYLDREHVLDYLGNFSNSTREVERVLVLSWPYYALSVIPFCNALVSLLEVQNILREITPSSGVDAPSNGASRLQLRYPVGRRKHGPMMRAVHALLPLYGLAVFVTTLAANDFFGAKNQHDEYICRHRVYPWFSTKEACLGREIHCANLGISGNAAELEQALDLFDENSLADLSLVNCSALVMPSKIQSFPQLMSIAVRDSMLVEWGEAAALTDAAFKELRTIHLFSVEFVQDPIGLIGVTPIAWSVEWIHLENMNVTNMLSKVGNHWRSLLFFDCVSCGLTSVPEPLFSMPRQLMIMLASNNLSVISDEWAASIPPQLQSLWMDDNPLLTELPDSMWKQSKTLGIFTFTGTNLSVVPEWVADVAGPEFMISAAGTPLCTGAAPVSKRVQKLIACD